MMTRWCCSIDITCTIVDGWLCGTCTRYVISNNCSCIHNADCWCDTVHEIAFNIPKNQRVVDCESNALLYLTRTCQARGCRAPCRGVIRTVDYQSKTTSVACR